MSLGDSLLLLALLGTLFFMGAALWFAGIRPRKPGQVDMILIGAAAGEAEARTWVAALRSAGVHAKVINVGDSARFTNAYAYEVWAPARDEARARQTLGFH